LEEALTLQCRVRLVGALEEPGSSRPRGGRRRSWSRGYCGLAAAWRSKEELGPSRGGGGRHGRGPAAASETRGLDGGRDSRSRGRGRRPTQGRGLGSRSWPLGDGGRASGLARRSPSRPLGGSQQGHRVRIDEYVLGFRYMGC